MQLDGEAEGCQWAVCMDQSSPGFAVAHQMKIDYFLTLNVSKPDVYWVTIFDYSCVEIGMKCGEHAHAVVMIDDE